MVRGTVASEHIVQLFDVVDSLGTGVAEFLSQGLAQDGNCLVVARPYNLELIEQGLTAAGYVPGALKAEGRFTVLDAGTTLRRFMRAGAPDAALFESEIGDLVRRLAAGSNGQLHVYGEMVDILAEEGSYQALERARRPVERAGGDRVVHAAVRLRLEPLRGAQGRGAAARHLPPSHARAPEQRRPAGQLAARNQRRRRLGRLRSPLTPCAAARAATTMTVPSRW